MAREPHFCKALDDDPEANAGLLAIAHNVSGSAFGAEQKHTDVATCRIWAGSRMRRGSANTRILLSLSDAFSAEADR
jgi:hypothetical protein